MAEFKPTSKMTLDSSKMHPDRLKAIESILYGSDSEIPRLPEPSIIWYMASNTPKIGVGPRSDSGYHPIEYMTGSDLEGFTHVGLYEVTPDSKMKKNGDYYGV